MIHWSPGLEFTRIFLLELLFFNNLHLLKWIAMKVMYQNCWMMRKKIVVQCYVKFDRPARPSTPLYLKLLKIGWTNKLMRPPLMCQLDERFNAVFLWFGMVVPTVNLINWRLKKSSCGSFKINDVCELKWESLDLSCKVISACNITIVSQPCILVSMHVSVTLKYLKCIIPSLHTIISIIHIFFIYHCVYHIISTQECFFYT